MQQQPEDKYSLGQVLIFNKPLHWTSFDLVNKVRWIISKNIGKKIKVGHAGTLDPLATGLMIICTGKKTKEITTFQDHDKEYVAEIKLGATTPSFDLETEINQTFDCSFVTLSLVEETLKTFLGKQIQYPPIFSAKKINGKRVYESARKGEDIKTRPQEIEIKEIELIDFKEDIVKIRVVCSKGTYIRSLAKDFGKRLNTGAHLIGLQRTKIGDIKLEDAIEIEDFQNFFLNKAEKNLQIDI